MRRKERGLREHGRADHLVDADRGEIPASKGAPQGRLSTAC